MPTGNGAPMEGPIGTPGKVTGRRRRGVTGGAVGGQGSRLLGPADLSRHPRPPSQRTLDAALARHYPKDAKQQGVEGVARVSVRVLPSGKTRVVRTLQETFPGFGEACQEQTRVEGLGVPRLAHRPQPRTPRARNSARFLSSVSWYSRAGSESRTMPAPA